MTDRLTPGQLRDLAHLHRVWKSIPEGALSWDAFLDTRANADGGCKESARREADSQTVRADGWRSDCPKCVESKFACDEHRKPDAPPPPAPDLADWSKLPVNMFVVSAKQIDSIGYEATLCNVPMVTAPEVLYVRADAIEAMRADAKRLREALEKIGKTYKADGARLIHAEYQIINMVRDALAQGGNDG